MAETPSAVPRPLRPKAIIFDLLTALLDSWTLWDLAASISQSTSTTPSTAVPITGQTWRRRYLHLTYTCGAYNPYESLVQQSAADVGLPPSAPAILLEKWNELKCWEDVPCILARLKQAGYRLGVVTNCSNELGYRAVQICEAQAQAYLSGDGEGKGEGEDFSFAFDAVTTAEESGYYKPHRKPYNDLLNKLAVSADEALFVAGSASDVPGAAGVGMKVVWHNRVGLESKDGVKPLKEGRMLEEVLEGVVVGF